MATCTLADKLVFALSLVHDVKETDTNVIAENNSDAGLRLRVLKFVFIIVLVSVFDVSDPKGKPMNCMVDRRR